MSRLYRLIVLFLTTYIFTSLIVISLVEERLDISNQMDIDYVTDTLTQPPSGQDRGRSTSEENGKKGSNSRIVTKLPVKYRPKDNVSNTIFNTSVDMQFQRNDNLENAEKNLGNVNVNISASLPMIQSCVKDTRYMSRLNNVFVNAADGLYLYSAFYDARETSPYIRIISAIERNYVNPKRWELWCYFDKLSESEAGSEYITAVSLYQMCENHRRRFGGWILSCPLPDKYATQGRQPCSVKVSTKYSLNDSLGSSAEISILTTERSREKQIDFAVCVPPLFGKIRSEDLVQFVELTRILGANYFVFYVYDANSQVKPVLSYYESKGIAMVLQWSVPTDQTRDIWYNGQSLAINDCLYRHMSTVKYLIFNDLDEFLIPHVPYMRSWRDIVASVKRNDVTCGMTFKSAFFDIALRANGNYTISNLTVLDITSRTMNFSGPRDKVMVEPYKVFEMGIHHVSRSWPDVANYSVFEAPPQLAYIHHYRHCDTTYKMNCMDGDNDTTVVDKYGDVLYRNYLQTIRNIYRDKS